MPTTTLQLDTVIAQHTRNLTGRVAAITGTTSGTGYVCARELARLGARVLLLNRESSRSRASLERLRADVPSATFEPIVCDLQDFASVREAARLIHTVTDRLDILCNNAGIMATPDQATRDGHCVQMQTNALSHFLLTRELMDLLERSDDARIVNHSSAARLGGPLEARYFGTNGGNLGGDESPEGPGGFRGPRWERYHQSKLANCAFTYGLKERLERAGKTHIKALVAHPGLSRTQLQITTASTGGMDLSTPFMDQAQTAEDGATGILRACADPTARSGDFFGPTGWTGFPERLTPEPMLYDDHNVRTNWDGCEAAVGTFSV